jgi:hypothetical protein
VLAALIVGWSVMGRTVPLERIRVSNADRARAIERLGRAVADGCVTTAEFDERVALAWAAVTRGDLTHVLEDLPAECPPPISPAPYIVLGHPVLRAVTSAWLAVTVLCIALWGLVGFVRADFGPTWWLWGVGPSGAVLSTLWLACDHRRPRRQ